MRRALALAAVFAALAIGACLVASPPEASPPFASVRADWRPSYAYLLDRNGKTLQAQRVDFQAQRLPWVALSDISPALLDAVVQIEDRRFRRHHGVDWRAVASAAWQNAIGRSHRGASTITMQVASLLDQERLAPAGRRGLVTKWMQMRAAHALERTWTKDELLEAYVNLVGYRGELRGIGAAASALLHKRPSGLTAAEAALLATLISAPNASVERVAERACALTASHGLGVDCSDLRALASDALRNAGSVAPMPALAPHLARRMLSEPGQRVTTTLNAQLQALTIDVLSRHLLSLRGDNVRDAAAVVLDNASGEVLAYVGSAGASSSAAAVDGAAAMRQAGSTLKPFLYGLAFERRYLTPVSLLEDAPINLETATGLYVPQNYDRDFKGTVSARTALASSLNVPAVRTLVLVGVEALRDRLYDLGYTGVTEDGAYYGYALALGSAEVTLVQQANAYRTLAQAGVWSPFSFRAGAGDVHPPRRVMPADVAFLVADILSDSAGRAMTFGLDSPLATPFWTAVKTGTSKDMRDNWCVGFSDRYTVAVWVGNFEGDSMQDVSGVSGAAPAWLDIMLALHADRASVAPEPPSGVVARDVEFEPPIEPPRRSYFLAGTELEHVVAKGLAGQSARIVNPPNGVIIAVDPDIPAQYQNVFIRSRGSDSTAELFLDGVAIGRANAAHPWLPRPGYHRLELRSPDGVLDSVRFTVRGPQ